MRLSDSSERHTAHNSKSIAIDTNSLQAGSLYKVFFQNERPTKPTWKLYLQLALSTDIAKIAMGVKPKNTCPFATKFNEEVGDDN